MIFLRQAADTEIPSHDPQPLLKAEGFQADEANGLWLECTLPDSSEAQTAFIETAATPGIAGLYVHGIESRADMEMCSALMAVGEAEANLQDGALGLIASVETPRALLNAADIAKGHSRLKAIVFGEDGLRQALLLEIAAPALMQAQATVLFTAKAANVPALAVSYAQATTLAGSDPREIAAAGFDGAVFTGA